MLVKTLPVTPFQQNARLFVDEASNEAVLVDPGGEAPKLLELIKSSDCIVQTIFLTHCHLDHVGAVADCLRQLEQEQGFRPQLLASEIEKEYRNRVVEQAMMFGVMGADFKNVPEPDHYLHEGETLSVGATNFNLLFTPGHAPGHFVAFCQSLVTNFEWYDVGNLKRPAQSVQREAPLLIAGDTLFAGSIGRTDLPGGNHQVLMESIFRKLMPLPDDTIVMPGHGPDTTIGREKLSNPFLN